MTASGELSSSVGPGSGTQSVAGERWTDSKQQEDDMAKGNNSRKKEVKKPKKDKKAGTAKK